MYIAFLERRRKRSVGESGRGGPGENTRTRLDPAFAAAGGTSRTKSGRQRGRPGAPPEDYKEGYKRGGRFLAAVFLSMGRCYVLRDLRRRLTIVNRGTGAALSARWMRAGMPSSWRPTAEVREVRIGIVGEELKMTAGSSIRTPGARIPQG